MKETRVFLENHQPTNTTVTNFFFFLVPNTDCLQYLVEERRRFFSYKVVSSHLAFFSRYFNYFWIYYLRMDIQEKEFKTMYIMFESK
jgi:hypothetical protein